MMLMMCGLRVVAFIGTHHSTSLLRFAGKFQYQVDEEIASAARDPTVLAYSCVQIHAYVCGVGSSSVTTLSASVTNEPMVILN